MCATTACSILYAWCKGHCRIPILSLPAYGVAVANISAKVISEFAPHLVGAVRDGGKVITSGILLSSKDMVAQSLADAGAELEQTFVDGDWVALVCRCA